MTMVSIIMGSSSDLPIMQQAAEILKEFQIPFNKTIVSAHRTPKRMVEFAEAAEAKGTKVIIAGAGGAAHLPGMVASLTLVPVIGVPILSSNSLDGWDSLLSIVQMPGGVPVATVAVNGAKNAAFLAIQILGNEFPEIREKLRKYRKSVSDRIISEANELEKGIE